MGRAQPLLYGTVDSTKPGPCGSALSFLRNVFYFILTVLKLRTNIPPLPATHIHFRSKLLNSGYGGQVPRLKKLAQVLFSLETQF